MMRPTTEHWLSQPAVLERFAQQSTRFNQDFATVELLNSGFVDLAYHLNTEPDSFEINAFENDVPGRRENLEDIPMRHRSTHFLHSFAGEDAASQP